MPDKTTPHILSAAKAMFADDHDEPWERGEELTRAIYLNNARTAFSTTLEPSEAETVAASNKFIELTSGPDNLVTFWKIRELLIAAARVRVGE